MHRLVLFASGQGSNAEAILRYFGEKGGAEVAAIVCTGLYEPVDSQGR